ncbi:MAG: LysR family transcriptional regulator [Burkholderiales bacterium]
MDRFEAMSVFATVVEAGSLSAAGRKLGMPLATVSRKISELESHIKTRLLVRSTRTLSLTDAGQSYLAACKRILEDVREAERVASGEYSAPKGELIVTAPIVFGRVHVLPVTAEFLKAYPDVDVRLVLGDRILNLWEDHVDVAVRVGELPDSSLIAMRVGLIRHVVCASPAYLAQHGTPRNPDELAKHECITFSGLMSSDSWTFRKSRVEVSVPVHSRLVVNTAEAAIDAAIAGVGLTRVLSYQVEQAIQNGALAIALKDFEPAPIPVSLMYAGRQLLALKLRAFLDFAAPRLRARLLAVARTSQGEATISIE